MILLEKEIGTGLHVVSLLSVELLPRAGVMKLLTSRSSVYIFRSSVMIISALSASFYTLWSLSSKISVSLVCDGFYTITITEDLTSSSLALKLVTTPGCSPPLLSSTSTSTSSRLTDSSS